MDGRSSGNVARGGRAADGRAAEIYGPEYDFEYRETEESGDSDGEEEED